MKPQIITATKLHVSQVFWEGKRRPVTIFNLDKDFVFEEEPESGIKVKVSAKSKGKGFTGVVKRYGFAGQSRTHGTKHAGRAPGSIGRGTTPGRVLPGKKMPGRHGQLVSFVKNLKISEYNKENNTLTLLGVTPGSRNTKTKITAI